MGVDIKKSGYFIIQDESINLPTRNTIDFQGAGAYVQDIGGKTIVFVPSIANLQDWVPNNFYPNGTYVVAVYENEYRIWRAMSSFTSGNGSFPAGNTIATDTNGYVGQWREVSPLRGSMTSVSFGGSMSYSASLTPPTLVGSNNTLYSNYSPTGLGGTNFLRVSSTNNVNIGGLLAPSPVKNQGIYVCNVGVGTITVKNEEPSSLAGNRFLLGTDKNLQPNEGIMLIYDDISLRWRSQAIQI